MHTVARQGARLAARETSFAVAVSRTSRSLPWICFDCRLKTQSSPPPPWLSRNGPKRSFTTSVRRSQDERQSPGPATLSTSSPASSNPPQSISTAPKLPSTAAQSRSDLSNRLTAVADSILARASVAGQHINVYTGTDYSGIQSLRQDIKEQESRVKTAYTAVETAKEAHHEEYAKQSAAQKEIVGLLERKSSWSPADLERYMSLVRSEHVNEQAVQNAKKTLDASERELEDTRQVLERLERKQYHEEQVWSDTIRRNSTWVTFGLMGVNILLLLGQILLFEPMRRKRIVRDLREALDEKTFQAVPSEFGSFHADASSIVESGKELERQIDEVVEPAGVSFDGATMGAQQKPNVLLSSARNLENQDSTLAPVASRWQVYQQKALDLFSDRVVQRTQVEVTNIALQGAATGVTAMVVLFAVLRQL